MKKRIFVAIPISHRLQEEIIEWEREYKTRLAPRLVRRSLSEGGSLGEGGVRWLTGKNLHVTLIPPWYEEHMERVRLKLQAFQGIHASFHLEFKRVCYGPDEKHPRLIWAEGQTPRELFTLKNNVEETFGQRSETRAFRLHLTLARFRPETFSSFPAKKLDARVAWRERPQSLALMESHLSPDGADYEILEEIPFAA